VSGCRNGDAISFLLDLSWPPRFIMARPTDLILKLAHARHTPNPYTSESNCRKILMLIALLYKTWSRNFDGGSIFKSNNLSPQIRVPHKRRVTRFYHCQLHEGWDASPPVPHPDQDKAYIYTHIYSYLFLWNLSLLIYVHVESRDTNVSACLCTSVSVGHTLTLSRIYSATLFLYRTHVLVALK